MAMDAREAALIREAEKESLLAVSAGPDHGWQKVIYPKRQRKAAPANPAPSDPRPNGSPGNVFASVELKAQERRRALESAAVLVAAPATGAVRSGAGARHAVDSDDDEEDSGAEAAAGKEGGDAGEAKKVKQKKPKKPKVTVAEAASKIDSADLAAFLVDVTGSYESQPDIQMMRFADYFARSFAEVSASQFPWTKIFKESPIAKIVDVPVCHISEPVYKTSVDWISQKPTEALTTFVLWTLDSIFADLASQQAAVKVSKKPVQQPSTKAQVAIFVVLAMTLRRKPDVLSNILPTLREDARYQGQDKLPIIMWVIAQASQGDPVVGMYAWVHNILPLMFGKSSGNPQVRDMVLQLVERILSGPKARPILLNGAVRKGERLVPPPALEQLMRLTFPSTSSRIKATERFEAIYPTLKELALAGSPGAKAMKPVSQQLLPASVKVMKENIPELTKEAADIFIWCLIQNPECFKQWEKLHIENVEASAAVLQKLADGWKLYATKFTSPDFLRESLKVLRSKNEEALEGGVEASTQATVKSADKYCKVILGRLSRGNGCLKAGLLVLTLVIAAGTFAVSPNMDSLDLKKLHVMFSSAPSF